MFWVLSLALAVAISGGGAWNTVSTGSQDAIKAFRDLKSGTFDVVVTNNLTVRTEASTSSNVTVGQQNSTVEDTSLDETTTAITGIEDICKPDQCPTANFCLYLKPKACIKLASFNLGDDVDNLTLKITVPGKASVIFLRMISETPEMKFHANRTIELHDSNGDPVIWHFLGEQKVNNRSYVSSGYELTLHISPPSNWTGIILDYREIVYDNSSEELDVDTGILKPPLLERDRYMPNLYKSYLLTPSRNRWNESSVTLLVKFVDLDESAGDMLLIGTGRKPFEGPPPVILSGERNDSTEYYAANEDAYIVFGSGSSNMRRRGFEIHWRRSGQFISEPEDDTDDTSIPDYVLKSVQVCFYNASFISEFNKTDEVPFPRFRKEMAEIANQYARERKLRLLSKLTENHVVIYRVSRVLPSNEEDPRMSDGIIYTMVAIVQSYNRKAAVFKRQDLEEILDHFDRADQDKGHSWLGFKVGHCPSGTNHIPWYIAAICLLILSMAVFISVWVYSIIWKWRGSSGKAHKTSLNFCCPDQSNPVKENEYVKVFSVPQLTITTVKGKILPLDEEHDHIGMVNFSDEESDTVIFTRSSEVNHTEPKALKMFSVPRPLSKSQISNRLWTPMEMDKLVNKDPEIDHVYDHLDPNITTTCLEHEESRL